MGEMFAWWQQRRQLWAGEGFDVLDLLASLRETLLDVRPRPRLSSRLPVAR